MGRYDDMWLDYIKYRGESSRNLLSSIGFTFGAFAGPGAVMGAAMMPLFGMMATSTQTGVMSFPDMINGTGEFAPAGTPSTGTIPPSASAVPSSPAVTPAYSATPRTVGYNNCMMDLWSMALNNTGK